MSLTWVEFRMKHRRNLVSGQERWLIEAKTDQLDWQGGQYILGVPAVHDDRSRADAALVEMTTKVGWRTVEVIEVVGE